MELILQVFAVPGDDVGELAGRLRGDLLDLDLQGVDQLPTGAAPVGAKGSDDVAGSLSVQLHPDALRVLLAKVKGWVARSDRMVEISTGGQTPQVKPPTRQQQEKVIDVFRRSLVPALLFFCL
jgi:hypothetical protein